MLSSFLNSVKIGQAPKHLLSCLLQLLQIFTKSLIQLAQYSQKQKEAKKESEGPVKRSSSLEFIQAPEMVPEEEQVEQQDLQEEEEDQEEYGQEEDNSREMIQQSQSSDEEEAVVQVPQQQQIEEDEEDIDVEVNENDLMIEGMQYLQRENEHDLLELQENQRPIMNPWLQFPNLMQQIEHPNLFDQYELAPHDLFLQRQSGLQERRVQEDERFTMFNYPQILDQLQNFRDPLQEARQNVEFEQQTVHPLLQVPNQNRRLRQFERGLDLLDQEEWSFRQLLRPQYEEEVNPLQKGTNQLIKRVETLLLAQSETVQQAPKEASKKREVGEPKRSQGLVNPYESEMYQNQQYYSNFYNYEDQEYLTQQQELFEQFQREQNQQRQTTPQQQQQQYDEEILRAAGIDPEVLQALPAEMRQEVIAQHMSTIQEQNQQSAQQSSQNQAAPSQNQEEVKMQEINPPENASNQPQTQQMQNQLDTIQQLVAAFQVQMPLIQQSQQSQQSQQVMQQQEEQKSQPQQLDSSPRLFQSAQLNISNPILSQPAQQSIQQQEDQLSQIIQQNLQYLQQVPQQSQQNQINATEEFLAALPPEIRQEVIDQQNRLMSQNSQSQGPQEIDNASFVASLTSPELRHEVLINATEEVLATLPPEMVAEARAIQERARQRQDQFLRSQRENLRVLRQGQGRDQFLVQYDRQIRNPPRPGLYLAKVLEDPSLLQYL